MNNKNNILIITDETQLAQDLESKVLLLRKNDYVVSATYNSALSKVEELRPIAILICENIARDITLGLISQIKTLSPSSAIILLYNEENPEFILSAYDNGADDFCHSNAENYELVIRIIKNLKFASQKILNKRNSKVLVLNFISDELTGLYNWKFAGEIYDSELAENIKDSGIFLIISPSEEGKKYFSMEKFANVVKNAVRADDVITLGKGPKIYVMLPKSDEAGALQVLEKINKAYGIECALKSGLTYYEGKENFKTIEKRGLNALSEAMFSDRSYCVFTVEKNEEPTDNWEDLENTSSKDFKLFKQTFYKKMDKVITPVFFRLQKIYEEKLQGVRINQFINENECVFHLKNPNQESRLKIIYAGFSKVVIHTAHEGFDSPENTEQIIPLAKLTTETLTAFVEDFIKNFMLTAV